MTQQAKLDGLYNRLGSNGVVPQTVQIQIANSGTTMRSCLLQGTPLSACPLASIATQGIAAGSGSGVWNLLDSSGVVAGSFSVAVRNGENVYLWSGRVPSSNTDAVFRIGVRAGAAWPAAQGWGVSTPGAAGAVSLAADGSMSFSATSFTGVLTPMALTFESYPLPDDPNSLYTATSDSDGIGYLAIQGAGILAFISNTSPMTTFHFSLLD